MKIDGLTGKIVFDEKGLRKNFVLNIMQVSLNRGPDRVSILPMKSIFYSAIEKEGMYNISLKVGGPFVETSCVFQCIKIS